jgi:hypothetical protein
MSQQIMLSVRVPCELRDQLKEAARANGRSLAQEVESRLTAPEPPALLTVLARVAELVEGTVGDWRTNVVAFDRLREGVDAVLERMRPEDRGEEQAQDGEVGAGRWAAKVALAEFERA